MNCFCINRRICIMKKCCCRSCINAIGFTLIELLVVVLIIGILAAIALPQYQKAVLKARVAEVKIPLKALAEAGDLWLLENGVWALPRFDELDVTIPPTTINWEFDWDEGDLTGTGVCAYPNQSGWGDVAICYTSHRMTTSDLAGKWWCSSGDEQGHKTCQKLDGTLIEGYSFVYELP